MLQTAVAVVVKNPKDSKELTIKVLFDNGSQCSYTSNRVANFLILPSESVEIFVSVHLEIINLVIRMLIKLTVQVNSKFEESIDLKVLSVPFICMLLENQPIKISQREFENL